MNNNNKKIIMKSNLKKEMKSMPQILIFPMTIKMTKVIKMKMKK